MPETFKRLEIAIFDNGKHRGFVQITEDKWSKTHYFGVMIAGTLTQGENLMLGPKSLHKNSPQARRDHRMEPYYLPEVVKREQDLPESDDQ